MTQRTRAAIEHYRRAREWIESSPFCGEVIVQTLADVDSVSETQFLREYAWVVLNSGFREAIVRRRFNYLSLCFCDWESAEAIVKARLECLATALVQFNNPRKLEAILTTADIIVERGFSVLYKEIRENPVEMLMRLPQIGPVTAFHLAKNLGFDFAKPDRHLVRLADKLGFLTADDMCAELSTAFEVKKSVIDVVLWRFSEQEVRIGDVDKSAK